MVYGGPHVQRVTESWELTADLTAQYLTARGFAVWKLDNRGSARRGHAFEAASEPAHGHGRGPRPGRRRRVRRRELARG